MTHLPFALAAYFLNGVSVLLSKFILTEEIKNPLTYLFYASTFSLILLLALPWTSLSSTPALIWASLFTLLWSVGAYLLVHALKIGQVDRVIPINGALIPALLLVFAISTQTVSYSQAWVVVILIGGLLFLTMPDWQGRAIKQEILLATASSLFFALAYLSLRQAFLTEDFLTVLVYSRVVLIPLGAVLLLVPSIRRSILASSAARIKLVSPAGALFVGAQILAGSAEILLNFSISLATPALVNSLQGSQYAFLFIASLMLAKKYPAVFKERLSLPSVAAKVIGLVLITSGLYLLMR